MAAVVSNDQEITVAIIFRNKNQRFLLKRLL